MDNADHNEYIKEKVIKAKKINTIMAMNKVDVWKKLYAWITYMRPHFQYAAHIFCNEKIDQVKMKDMDPQTRTYIKHFN